MKNITSFSLQNPLSSLGSPGTHAKDPFPQRHKEARPEDGQRQICHEAPQPQSPSDAEEQASEAHESHHYSSRHGDSASPRPCPLPLSSRGRLSPVVHTPPLPHPLSHH